MNDTVLPWKKQRWRRCASSWEGWPWRSCLRRRIDRCRSLPE